MKYVEVSQLQDGIKKLYEPIEDEIIEVYESVEEFLSCNLIATKEAIEKRVAEKLEEYNNLPEGAEKQAIIDAINGMYVGMFRDPSEKTPENYFRVEALIELFDEENNKQDALLAQANPLIDGSYYILVGHDYDRYEGGDFAVGAFTSLEALQEVSPLTSKYYEQVGGLSTNLKVVDMNGHEIKERAL